MRRLRILLALVYVVVPITASSEGAQSAPLPPLPITQLEVRQAADPDLDGRRISLAYFQPTSIRAILLRLVRNTRLSVIPDPSLEQTFVGELKNVTVREALDLIVEPLGLSYAVRGQVIRVFPREPETRFYNIDYVSTRRPGRRPIAAGAGAFGSAGTQAERASQAEAAAAPSLYDDLSEGVRTLLSKDGRMSLDRTAGLLRVTDTASRLAQVERYLEAVMLRVTRQVQIETKVIEVELRDKSSGGIDWRPVFSALPIPQSLAPVTSGNVRLALKAGDYGAFLSALAAQGEVDVLSSPRITAMNNEPAFLRIGTQDVFFVTTAHVDPQGHAIQTAVTPRTLTEGFALSVTPQISVDGFIHLSISPSVTQQTGVATSRSGETVPVLTVREADTVARVQEGETVVIAGLVLDREQTGSSGRRRTDLVILLTPTLMAR